MESGSFREAEIRIEQQSLAIDRILDNFEILEIAEILNNIDKLLAKIVEYGDVDPQTKSAWRSTLKELLGQIGLTELSQLPGVYDYMHQRRTRESMTTHEKLPSFEGFVDTLNQVINDMELRTYEVEAQPPRLKYLATAIADYGWIENSRNITGRGQELSLYCYGLARLMTRSADYSEVFFDDPIRIDTDYKVDNGRHRALTLMALGSTKVLELALNKTVAIDKSM